MTLFDYEKDNILDYSDDSLRILKDKIEKELERREKEKETEAKKKVMKAIQDYLAAVILFGLRVKLKCPMKIITQTINLSWDL